MKKTVIRIAALAAAMLSVSLVAASGGEAATTRCAPRGAQVAAADSKAEVYFALKPTFDANHKRLRPILHYRGCGYGSRRSFDLGTVEAGGKGGGLFEYQLTLSGTFVAYARFQGFIESPAENEVVVRNLRTGRTLADVPTGVPLQNRPGYVGVGSVRQMVLSSSGAAAWIARDDLRSEILETEAGHFVEDYDLYTLDRTGEHLVASGTGIDKHSLALAGGTLYWTDNGDAMSTRLD
jgi:hypothetical protein